MYSEDSTILSQITWNREQQIYQLRFLVSDIQSVLFCRGVIDPKVEQLSQMIMHIKNQEGMRITTEQKTINKYFIVRTDAQYQKQLMFSVLESVLNNYKKLGTQYECKALFAECTQLKQDVERLKSNLRDRIMQFGGASIAEVLQLLSQFSRGRLDVALEASDRHATIWQDQFSAETVIKRIKLRANRRSVDPEPVPPPPPREQHSNTDRNVAKKFHTDHAAVQDYATPFNLASNPHIYPMKYYQGKLRKCIAKPKMAIESQETEPSLSVDPYAEPLRSQPHRTYVQRVSIYTKLQKLPVPTSITLPATQPPQQFTHYLTSISPKSDPQCYTPLYVSTCDTCINNNYYSDLWSDAQPMNESDQRVYLYRLFKDQLRQNSQIATGIEQYRRGYIVRRMGQNRLIEGKPRKVVDIRELARMLNAKAGACESPQG